MPEGPAAKGPEFKRILQVESKSFEPQLTFAGASPPFFSLLVWKNLHFHGGEAEMHAWSCCTAQMQGSLLVWLLLCCQEFLVILFACTKGLKPPQASPLMLDIAKRSAAIHMHLCLLAWLSQSMRAGTFVAAFC